MNLGENTSKNEMYIICIFFLFMLREKIQTILKMNLLSSFSRWEICASSHLLYFLCLNSLSMWTFVFPKGEKLKDKMCCVCPLNLINWYSFPDIISEGVRDIFPNLLKSTEVLQTLVLFGPGWKRNVSLSISWQVILFFSRMFPSLGHLVMHLLLWNTAVGLFLSLWWSQPADASFILVSKSRMWL